MIRAALLAPSQASPCGSKSARQASRGPASPARSGGAPPLTQIVKDHALGGGASPASATMEKVAYPAVVGLGLLSIMGDG